MKVHAIVLSEGERLRDFVDLHFLLEKFPMQNILRSYHEKYRELGMKAAAHAVIQHGNIDFKGTIVFMGHSLAWKEVAGRLREAVMEPEKVFSKKVDLLKKPGLDMSPSMGKRKGKGRRM